MKDLSFDIDPQFYSFLKGVAIKNNIPYQNFYSNGGTDSSALFISNKGAKGTTIGLPTRYIHSASAIFDFDDLNSCEKLLINSIDELIKLSNKELEELLFK
jgi:endoglucanase